MCRSELRLPGSWQLHCAERKLIIHELVVTADLVRAPGGHQPALFGTYIPVQDQLFWDREKNRPKNNDNFGRINRLRAA